MLARDRLCRHSPVDNGLVDVEHDARELRSGVKPYQPINLMKPIAPDVLIVDGPGVRMRYFGPWLLFIKRVTVVCLLDGSVFLHSPTEDVPELAEEVVAAVVS